MSVWPNEEPAAPLSSSQGALVSVSIAVDSRHLESLLEALASVSFPINPQIHHDCAAATLVEFPAYEPHVEEVRRAIEAFGFDPQSLRTRGMWDKIAAAGA
jgi:hypothetical protein